MKKINLGKKQLFYILAALVFLALATALFSVSKSQTPLSALSQEDLAKLVKPAVVRIVHHFKGEYSLPKFDVDLKTAQVTVVSRAEKTKPLDNYVSGSGFVVNPDGYIFTNSHVVSQQTIKRLYVEEALDDLITEKTKNLTSSEKNELFANASTLENLDSEAVNKILAASLFELQSEIVVLNPTVPYENLPDLLKSGFTAELVSINDNFAQDGKDVGLIKIALNNLPTLMLAEPESVSVGNKIYAFGFPGTGEFNRRSPLEATLTSGLISSIKFSQNKDFKIFQTDAKISQGSSGGPLFNDKGQVIGLVTFLSVSLSGEVGDSFAFAVPSSLATQILQKQGVANELSEFEKTFRIGLAYSYQNQCQKAIEQFKAAAKTNQDFIGEKYLNPYLQRCQNLITSGQSRDNFLSQDLFYLRSISLLAWFVILGRLVLIFLAIWLLLNFSRRLHRDEAELSNLSYEVEEERAHKEKLFQNLIQKGVELPLPEELHAVSRTNLLIPHPHLAEYIKEARAVGLADKSIKEELTKAGWGEQEILQVLQL